MQQDDLQIKEIEIPNEILLPEIFRMLDEGHTVTIRLRGFSMRPFLENDRDKALLKKAENFKVGDPVLAEISDKHFVLHRIVCIKGDYVTLRGDGNIGTEECHLNNVKGSVIGFYRKGRSTLDRTDSAKWKIYSWVWVHLLPLRRYLLFAYRHIWLKLFRPI